ncbi:hypothetical protein AQUCO_02000339v1 [Aquilegia coerulea]|uniref:DUF295 domain-containing protein n=1 Tax=Aquilegia coerulea TaxID=218851 RepID=A0A2G5DH65_AQUCA|nr:hypothetical protein AQUCO_02000339v1 [Aquilegia coerulea]
MISSRPKFKRCVNHPKWAELPSCLLNDIMDRLILLDEYVQFSAVCVSWRNVFDEDKKKKHSYSSSLPLLLVPPHSYKLEEEVEGGGGGGGESYHISKKPRRPGRAIPNNVQKQKQLEEARRKRRLIPQTRSLYNVVTQKVCDDFEVKLPHNYYCRGSSFGWLVTMKPKVKFGYYYKYYVQLYNPFLSYKHNIINLPPLYKILKQDGGNNDVYDGHFCYIRKAVLSWNPMFARNNFVVMAIVSQEWKLAFYTPDNRDWTPVNWEREDTSNFEDIIYFNKTKQFYAVLPTGAVLAIDLITDQGGEAAAGEPAGPHIIPKLTQVAPPIHGGDAASGVRYLVETSSGELLQVHKVIHLNGSSVDDYAEIVKFQVFKLDPAKLEWTLIHDMGDTILFLGDNSSISRSASDFPGCKPNCIYYTDHMAMEQKTGRLYKPQDMGIYNLADGTHQQHYPMASRINFPSPIWLEPTFQRSTIFNT